MTGFLDDKSHLDCGPPVSSILGIFQARILEWVAISFSRGSCQPRDRTQVSCIAGRLFTVNHQGIPMTKLAFMNRKGISHILKRIKLRQDIGPNRGVVPHDCMVCTICVILCVPICTCNDCCKPGFLWQTQQVTSFSPQMTILVMFTEALFSHSPWATTIVGSPTRRIMTLDIILLYFFS